MRTGGSDLRLAHPGLHSPTRGHEGVTRVDRASPVQVHVGDVLVPVRNVRKLFVAGHLLRLVVEDESIDDISSFIFALTTSYLAYRTMLANNANHLDD